jgi:hypothetical protein
MHGGFFIAPFPRARSGATPVLLQRLKQSELRVLLCTRGQKTGIKPMRKGIAADLGSEGTAMQGHGLDWRKRMSDTVAYSLLVYTSLQIFVTLRTLEGEGGSMLPMIALVVLVAGVIPMFRHFERRWEALSDAAAADPALRGDFRRDQLATWAVAIGLPFLLAAVFRMLVLLG